MLEMIWSRPTCDVNGIIGGYTGKGSKTVLPAQASAKFSFRLVGTRDPAKIVESFPRLCARAAAGRRDGRVYFAWRRRGALQSALRLRGADARAAGAERRMGHRGGAAGCGGSIPIVGAFKRDLGMDALMIGFALEDDRIHSPNEKYSLTSFHKGARSWARVLAALAA